MSIKKSITFLRFSTQWKAFEEYWRRCRIHNLTEWEIGVKPSKVEVDQGGVKVGFCIFYFKSWNFLFGWGGPRCCQDEMDEELVFVVVKFKVH